MSRLEPPIKDHLRDPADERALQRMWGKIEAKIATQIGAQIGARRAHRRARRPFAVAFASLAAVAGAAAVVGYARRDPGPLRRADGGALVAVTAPTAGMALPTSDGSTIHLSEGARFEPLESSGTMFLAVLQRGSAGFDVRPGGPRRWQIECGLATVEVTGTQFRCERSPGRLRVSVQHGTVLVRGERVADRVRRLAAGEWLDIIEEPSPAREPAGAVPTPMPGTDPAPDIADTADARAAASWRELARRGQHGDAFAALGPRGLRRETKRLGVGDLLALADVARLSGHPADAVAPLGRILASFADDPQAPLAAFALGRLELDALGRPGRAAIALNRALMLGVPQTLREDVRARLVEAHARAGDRAAARAAADAYAREFPGGRHAQAIASWLSGAR